MDRSTFNTLINIAEKKYGVVLSDEDMSLVDLDLDEDSIIKQVKQLSLSKLDEEGGLSSYDRRFGESLGSQTGKAAEDIIEAATNQEYPTDEGSYGVAGVFTEEDIKTSMTPKQQMITGLAGITSGLHMGTKEDDVISAIEDRYGEDVDTTSVLYRGPFAAMKGGKLLVEAASTIPQLSPLKAIKALKHVPKIAKIPSTLR